MLKLLKQAKRYQRLLNPSPAEKLFMDTMGLWFMLRYRVKREYPVSGFYIDYALPQYRMGFEIDGRKYHKDVIGAWSRDRKRDFILQRAGWEIIHIDATELYRNPKDIRRRVLYEVRGL